MSRFGFAIHARNGCGRGDITFEMTLPPNSSYPPYLYTIVDGQIVENLLDREELGVELFRFAKQKYVGVVCAEIIYDIKRNGYVARVELEGEPPTETTYVMEGHRIPLVFDRKGELMGVPIVEAYLL